MQCWGGRGTRAATALLLCQGLPSQTLLFAVSFLQGCQISHQPNSTTESPTDWFLDSLFQGVVILSDACPSEDTGTRWLVTPPCAVASQHILVERVGRSNALICHSGQALDLQNAFQLFLLPKQILSRMRYPALLVRVQETAASAPSSGAGGRCGTSPRSGTL